jgi:PST family polysaccharide transporter
VALRAPAASSGLRARTLRGFLLVGGQRVLTILVSALGGIALARLLLPDVFGIYTIISFAVTLGVVFSDVGLGAALIQRRDPDDDTGLTAAFVAQLALAVALGGALIALAPTFGRWLGVPPAATGALRALGLLVPLAALRMPAAVLLERRLVYLPLTIADTLETVVFHAVAIGGALAGGGVWSFVLGALAGRLAGVLTVWSAVRWRPAPGWRWRDLGRVLRFGVFFHASALVTMARDAVVPLIVGAWAGLVGVGLVNWATALAFLPLQVISIAGRVLFPALAHLQHDPVEFARATERALNRVAVVVYPAALLLMVAAEPVTRFVYGSAWLPAVPAVRILCVTTLVGGTSNLLVHALYALGRADTVLRLNLAWTALLWVLTPLLVPSLGVVGFALGSAGVALTMGASAVVLRRLVPVRVLRPVATPLAASTLAALALAGLERLVVHDLGSLIGAAAGAGLLYLVLLWLGAGAAWRVELLADWRTVWQGRA